MSVSVGIYAHFYSNGLPISRLKAQSKKVGEYGEP